MNTRELIGSTSSLDPVVEQRLVQFGRRRQQLRLLRGSAWWLSIVTVTMLVCVLLQASFASETIDLWVSLAFYAISISTLAWFVLRPSLQRAPLPNLARLLERLDRRLKDRILPAVELAESSSQRPVGSPAFHAEIQRCSGDAVEHLDCRQVLPWRRIRLSLRSCGVCLVALLIVVCVPSWQAWQRFAQVLVPIGNIGKVTLISVTIVRPLPQSRSLPTGDSLAIAAEVQGPAPAEAVLEWRSQEFATKSQQMSPSPQGTQTSKSPGRFESVLVIDARELDYRVTCADAATPWYRLTTTPRPSIEAFLATVQPPEYSLADAQADYTAAEYSAGTTQVAAEPTDGNLQVMQGSEVVLSLRPNIALQSAELQWEDKLPLDFVDGLWTVRFTPTASGDYKIFMRAADSGYTNEFDPTYRLTVLDDEPPRLRWLTPRSNPHMVLPQTLLELTLETRDEYPVQEVVLERRVNKSAWSKIEATALSTRQPSEVDFESVQSHGWTLDILPWKLVGGDQVDIVARVSDGKGQSRTSQPMQIVVSELQLAAATSPAFALRQQIAQRLQELAIKIGNAFEPLSAAAEDGLLQRELLDGARKDLLDIFGLIEQTSLLTPDFAERIELKYAGEALASLHLRLASAMQADQSSAADSWNRALESSGDVPFAARQLADAFQTWTTHDRIALIAAQFTELRTALEGLRSATGTSGASVPQLVRQQSVLALQMQRLQQELMDETDQLRPESVGPVERLADLLGTQIAIIERESDQQQLGTLHHNTSRLVEILEGVRTTAEIDSNLLPSVTDKRLEMGQRYGMSSSWIEVLHRELHANSLEDLKTNSVMQTVNDHLELVRSLNRAVQVGGGALSADFGLANRAIGHLQNDSRLASRPSPAQTTRQIFLALRILESDDALHNAMRALTGLLGSVTNNGAAAEDWPSRDSRDGWYLANESLRIALHQLQQADIPGELIVALWELVDNSLARAMQASEQRSREQIAAPETNRAVEQLVAKEIALELAIIQARLKPIVLSARTTLRQLAPSIERLARRAAQDASRLSTASEQLADSLESSEVPTLPPRLIPLQSKATAVSRAIDELHDALVDMADSQDLLSRDQIELAKLADVALSLATEAEQQIDRSMQSILDSAQAQVPIVDASAAATLAQASQQQSEAARILEMIGDILSEAHLESRATAVDSDMAARIAAPEALAEASLNADQAALRAQQQAAAEPYAQAERLAQIAAAQPTEVLRQLERQLPINKAMQRELSNIARQSIEQAQQQLSATANRQRQLSASLERSDPAAEAEQQQRQAELQLLQQNLRSIPLVLAAEAKWAAGSARQPDMAMQLGRQVARLEELADDVAEGDPRVELADSDVLLERLRGGLQTAAREADRAAQSLRPVASENVHKTPSEREQKRRELKDRGRRLQQRLARNAQQLQRNFQQQVHSAAAAHQNATGELQRAAQQKKRALENLTRNREKSSAENQRVQAEAELERREQAYQLAQLAERETLAAVEIRQAAAAQQPEPRAKWNRYQVPSLDSENPSAELAAELALLLSQSVRELAENLKQPRISPEDVQATADSLSSATAEQQSAVEQIKLSKSSLERAARHEFRLQQQANALQLSQLANSIGQSPGAAAAQSKADLQTAEREGRQSNDTRASAASTQKAIASARNSAATTQAAADELQQVLDSSTPMDRSLQARDSTADRLDDSRNSVGENGENTLSSAATNNSNMPLNGEALARLLDELDQQLNSADRDPGELGEQEDGSGGGRVASDAPAAESVAPTLSQAARRLAEQLSRQRQPPSDRPPGDIGMATDSAMAETQPQSPTRIELLDVNRLGDDWDSLTERAADDVTGTRRRALPIEYRAQVEAYFRELATRAANGTESER